MTEQNSSSNGSEIVRRDSERPKVMESVSDEMLCVERTCMLVLQMAEFCNIHTASMNPFLKT